jgi:creatinine amidohydrolase
MHARTAGALWLLSASIASAEGGPKTDSAPRPAAASTVSKLEEMTWPQVDALDREKTMFILPVGMIEEHGPHLPVGADTLGVGYEAERTSRRVAGTLRGWTVVLMPPVNYGQGGAHELGGILVHPGTVAIRQSTLRSLVADLGAQLAQSGFKWIFVVNGHAAPAHGIALNQACDFVSETFRVTMLHLTGLLRADPELQSRKEKIDARFFSRADLYSFGLDVHAGVAETSGLMAVRPDLVRPSYKRLPDRVGRSLEELSAAAAQPGWEGYFSSPARATPSYGRAINGWWIEGFAELILRAIRGENLHTHPRFHETLPSAVAPLLEKGLANETAFDARLQEWLRERGHRVPR